MTNPSRFRLQTHLLLVTILIWPLSSLRAERIKDIVDIKGIRSNPLSGIGLVVGLGDNGDSGGMSQQMLTNILRGTGLVLPPSVLKGKNNAVVIVTGQLGPFAREGSRFDVNVSAIGDAKSLSGGTLVATPLRGLDGQTYAVAAGSISLAGWIATGEQASVTKNHQTVGRIPGGATVELEELSSYFEFLGGKRIVTLELRNNDFSTAIRIAEAINETYPESAVVLDPGTIRVAIPDHMQNSQIPGFVVAIQAPSVTVDMEATVVVNERTGTIVVGEHVAISATAIAHGSLVISISETENVSQPGPFSPGQTVASPQTNLEVEEATGSLILLPHAGTVSELANALNRIGTNPGDLIAILAALQRQGSLQAKLIIM